jgi:phosphoglucosamine mutase
MSNLGLELALTAQGGSLVRAPVGDRYVLDAMRAGGYNLGGEQSGHMIFLEHNTTGDGIISALQVLAIMQKSGKCLSELASVMRPLPQILVNVRVRQRLPLEQLPDVQRLIEDVERRLSDTGRVLIRYSGTEPLMRIMLEGQDQDEITGMANQIAELVKISIGEDSGA